MWRHQQTQHLSLLLTAGLSPPSAATPRSVRMTERGCFHRRRWCILVPRRGRQQPAFVEARTVAALATRRSWLVAPAAIFWAKDFSPARCSTRRFPDGLRAAIAGWL